jgi:hypothetical protein
MTRKLLVALAFAGVLGAAVGIHLSNKGKGAAVAGPYLVRLGTPGANRNPARTWIGQARDQGV